ncbi:helix-turn-helix protein [Acinetobacter calcoaceticus]|uniref:Helix-turn-helix protein n=1 Tax=Acinetobacter calcoaceticus TaxID=471 RepID=A0A4R1XT42_ACICA|nr:helix-turn-helix protein [Acinetobacter calcoaceticus]
MDKRFKALSPIEQIQKRQQVLDSIEQHPEWEIHQVAKFLRTELRLTLQEMALITQISPQTLQKLEQAEGNPTLQSILKLFNAFNLTLMVKRK